MAADTESIAVFAVYLLAATLASWRWFWARHAKPRERGKVALGIIGFAVFGAIPLLAVAIALHNGQMPCWGRLCKGPGSALADSPIVFWIQAGVLGAMSALFLGAVLFGIGWLVRSFAMRR